MKKEKEHIKPRIEGGSDEPWNIRYVSRKENEQKGARMPNLNEVSESSNPIKLAVDIDKGSLQGPFKHPRNRNRGFGGLPR